ncbi:DUF3383 family protein [Leptospira interrogans]|uniref:DUF3383 family protein n=1 Tax=Leptospira interrogans TaxID=173 RepID=UPI000347077D|nr:DUF3383 family protein [Leptospira interrogans]UMQ59864.1 DUF3383 domain-containing protein [Leptospira interrogans]UNE68787.1 DUF3383 domain-containing protein [Leptospira interrogans]
MSQISNIAIDIALKTLPLAQKGFGLALVAGISPRNINYELDILSGVSGIKWKAVTKGETYIEVEYVVTGNSSPLSVSRTGSGTSADPYLISVHLATNGTGVATSTAAQIKTAAEGVNEVGGSSKIITLSLLENPGNGIVTTFQKLFLVDPTDPYLEIQDADELLDPAIGYSQTSSEYKMAQAIFSGSPRAEKIAVVKLDSFITLPQELADLRNDGFDSWYCLLTTTRVLSEIKIASTYLNSLEKYYICGTADQSIVNELINHERTLPMISNHSEEFPDAAWFGRCGSAAIGSIQWDSKQLNGQRNSDVTMSEQSQILAKNGNLIREMGGVNVTWEGKTLSGQYIDNIHGRDYLKARLQEAYHSLKINNDKIPMTISGLRMVEAALREVFRDCGRREIIAKVEDADGRSRSDLGDFQYKLSMPETISDIPTNDRANRKVPQIKFSATIGGGINKIEISGTMGV